MSAPAAIILWKTMRDALLSDNALAAKCGPDRIFDEAPGAVDPPYIALADVRSRDWSTASDAGTEITLALEIWSKHHGLYECLEIAALAETVINGIASIPDNNLVLLQFQRLDSGRRERGTRAFARLTYRALVDSI